MAPTQFFFNSNSETVSFNSDSGLLSVLSEPHPGMFNLKNY